MQRLSGKLEGVSSRTRTHAFLWTALSGLALTAASVAVVKHKDQDNRFCIACHLHEELSRATTAPVPATLAAAHFQARSTGHPERCFTCHSGEGPLGWTQVTVLSAWDAARWVAGDRHEPDSMRLRLDDPACLKCHASDLTAALAGRPAKGLAAGEFHWMPEHRNPGVRCVACHTAHTEGARSKDYMGDAVVRRECARCHPGGLGTESDS